MPAALHGWHGLAVSLELQTAAVYLGSQVEVAVDPAENQVMGARLRRPADDESGWGRGASGIRL